ncbi:MAG: bifunctional DNA-formamidopyrimidine glycosylase/DNA-(apurinic or apyrimidinic site) lyase [Acidobacteria bacterium]|nr:bifunctional DNA-formamidopyrimidine glycosylase/DNA-(apurinic or apyrimidinic site) lyase [Acidobacteriota bacterium]
MPELPEVEHISRSLDSILRGRTIAAAKLLRAKLAPDSTPSLFARSLKNRTINFVHRRGKHILFDLSGGGTLVVHLRMSGRFSLLPAEREDPKFTHAVFYFGDDTRLVFDDQRHFGLMKIVETARLNDSKELKKLAPEPFSSEFSLDYFHRTLRSSKRSLKEFLVDQTKVTGLGNIYAAEAMFTAGIHPAVKAHKVSRPRAEKLFDAALAILEEAISYGANLPVDPENLEGNYFSAGDTTAWYVYDREGEACKRCKTPIARVKQGARSTYFCPACQRR